MDKTSQRLKIVTLYLFLMCVWLFAGCTRAVKSTSYLQINLPAGSQQIHNFVHAEPMSMDIVHTTSNDVPWNTSLNPTSMTDVSHPVNCYAIAIAGPESGMRNSMCTTTAGQNLYVGVFAGAIPQGGQISIDVPSGPQREITIIGFNAQNGACRSFANNVDKGNLSEPFVIGKVIQDLAPGDVVVNVPVTIDANTFKIADCQGPAFNLLGQHGFDFGDASGGNYTVSASAQLDTLGAPNQRTAFARVIGYSGNPQTLTTQTNLTVSSYAGFSQGDEVMILVSQASQTALGPTGDNNYAGCGYRAWDGNYQFAYIVNVPSVDGFVAISKGTFIDRMWKDADKNPTSFEATDLAAANAALGATPTVGTPFCFVQLVRVPHFDTFHMSASSTLGTKNFTSTGGGVVAFRAKNLILDDGSTIAMNALGYNGHTGMNGDGMSGAPSACTTSNITFTGGACSSSLSIGGGGGGNGSTSSLPYFSGGFGGSPSGNPAGGSAIYDNCGDGSCFGSLLNKIAMGGAGGAGYSSGGAPGGGIVYISAETITVPTVASSYGTINVSGAIGSAGAGAGAGGSVILFYKTINMTDHLNIKANGGGTTAGSGVSGGGGGGGRVHSMSCLGAGGVSQALNSANIDVTGGLAAAATNSGQNGGQGSYFKNEMACPF